SPRSRWGRGAGPATRTGRSGRGSPRTRMRPARAGRTGHRPVARWGGAASRWSAGSAWRRVPRDARRRKSRASARPGAADATRVTRGRSGMPLRRWLVPCALVLSAALPCAARAAGDSGAFVMTLGRDTLALERFTRAGGSAAGTLVYRPVGLRFEYTLTLAPDGAVRRMETTVRAAADPPGAPPKQTATLEGRAGRARPRRRP